MTMIPQKIIMDTSPIHHVLQPIQQAKGMPNSAYTSQNSFEFERDNVLGKTWVGIAFMSDLPATGYVKPIEFMGLPLALMRNKDGTINVFHNVCSHRGMILVQQEEAIKGMIRCPYHSWTYNLDGQLKGTPHIGGLNQHSTAGFQCEQHGLKAVRSANWMDIIFINLSGDAPEFEAFIAPLVERWETFTGKAGLSQLCSAPDGNKAELVVQSNWKLAIENYCEAYHLPWVHPTLNSYSPLSEHYNIIINDYMSGQGSRHYNLAAVAGTKLPQFASWPADKLRHAEYLSLYPNVMLGIQADHAFALILDPQSPDKTIEKLQILYVSDKATDDDFIANRASVLDSWKMVFAEDVFAVEGMQRGRQSPAFQGGVFSPALDQPTHHFHCWMAKQYLSSQEV